MKKHSNILSSPKGFTLVELLVVIGILGVLAAAVLTAVNPQAQLAKARNGARKAALKQMADALERYKVTQGTYPPGGYCAAPGSYWTGCGANWIPGLVASGELKALPLDPLSGKAFAPCNDPSASFYLYVSNGTDYKLMAYCGLEGTPPTPDPFLDPLRPTYTWAVWSSPWASTAW